MSRSSILCALVLCGACAEYVDPGTADTREPHMVDASGASADSVIAHSDAADAGAIPSDASADAPSRCAAGTVDFEGACCWIALEGECAPSECGRWAPTYANRAYCANPQLCCATP